MERVFQATQEDDALFYSQAALLSVLINSVHESRSRRSTAFSRTGQRSPWRGAAAHSLRVQMHLNSKHTLENKWSTSVRNEEWLDSYKETDRIAPCLSDWEPTFQRSPSPACRSAWSRNFYTRTSRPRGATQRRSPVDSADRHSAPLSDRSQSGASLRPQSRRASRCSNSRWLIEMQKANSNYVILQIFII